jgi:hypothetical protein
MTSWVSEPVAFPAERERPVTAVRGAAAGHRLQQHRQLHLIQHAGLSSLLCATSR